MLARRSNSASFGSASGVANDSNGLNGSNRSFDPAVAPEKPPGAATAAVGGSGPRGASVGTVSSIGGSTSASAQPRAMSTLATGGVVPWWLMPP